MGLHLKHVSSADGSNYPCALVSAAEWPADHHNIMRLCFAELDTSSLSADEKTALLQQLSAAVESLQLQLEHIKVSYCWS